MCRRTARKLPWIRSDEETPAEVKPPNKQQTRQNDIQLCHFVCISLVGIVVAKKECEGRKMEMTGRPTKENKQNNMCNNKKEIRR